MKLTDLVQYTPVFTDENNVTCTGVPTTVTVAEFVSLIDGVSLDVAAADITDATATGISLITAADAGAARTAAGLGTIATEDQVANIAAQAGDFADLAAVTTAYNALLAAMKTAGVMVAD